MDINEEIYKLRESGKSAKTIAGILNSRGIEISTKTVERRCKAIYEKKGEKEPVLKRGPKEIPISFARLYELRCKGLSCAEITGILNVENIRVSKRTVEYRCKKMCEMYGIKNERKSHQSVGSKGNGSRLALLEEKLNNTAIQSKEVRELIKSYEQEDRETEV